MNKADKAESLFRTGYNCSQSVYAAFAEELGITVEEAAKKASPFGAGFGKLREVCGAVTGMVMVICTDTMIRKMRRGKRSFMHLCRSFAEHLKNRKEV